MLLGVYIKDQNTVFVPQHMLEKKNQVKTIQFKWVGTWAWPWARLVSMWTWALGWLGSMILLDGPTRHDLVNQMGCLGTTRIT